MVSFNCDACGDVVKKPKLLQHYQRCYTSVTCLDCSMQFNSPNEFKMHNSCISEAEKYQKSVYKGPGGKKGQQQQQRQNGNGQVSPQKEAHQAAHAQDSPAKEPASKQNEVTAASASTSESPSKKKKDKRKREEAAAATEVGTDLVRETKKAKKVETKDKKDKKDKVQDKVDDAAEAKKDDRFDLSQFDGASTSKVAAAASGSADDDDDDGNENEEEDEEAEGEHDQDDPMDEAKVIKPLNPEELEAFEKKQRKLGIIYISRIPPGMTPAKVRHILSNFGEIGRMYLKDGSQRPGDPAKFKKRSSAFYTEGWVEFLSKKVAKATADMLNAQPIGALAASKSKGGGLLAGGIKAGKTTRRFQDEIWTMKYLKGFKWHMLSEQMAQERASLTARMRNEMSQSAYEQNDYLRKVERAKMQKYKEDKKRKRALKKGETLPNPSDGDNGRGAQQDTSFKTFRQKKPIIKDVRDKREAPAA